MRDLREAMPSPLVLTLAYYPDGKQELLLHKHEIDRYYVHIRLLFAIVVGSHLLNKFRSKKRARAHPILGTWI